MCKTYGPSLPQADCIQVCEIVRGLPCLQHVQSCVAFEKDCAFAALWISGLWTSPKFQVDNFDISNLALLVHRFILRCASVLRLFWQLCVLLSLWPQEQAGGAYVAEQTLRQHHNGPGGPTSCTVSCPKQAFSQLHQLFCHQNFQRTPNKLTNSLSMDWFKGKSTSNMVFSCNFLWDVQ